MNAKEIHALAMISGVASAALAAEPQRHFDGLQQSAVGIKRLRKLRNAKRRMAKASKRNNRR